MSAILIRRGTLAGVALLAIVTVAACAGEPGHAGQPPTGKTTPAASAAASQTSTPAASAPTEAPSASATPSGAGAVQNLATSPGLDDELRSAFQSYKGLGTTPLYGPVPSSVYYAFDPATETYWALATFYVDSEDVHVPANVDADFKAGAGFAMFREAGGAGAPWQAQSTYCPRSAAIWKFFPPAVLEAWSISTSVPLGSSGLVGVDC